MSTPAPTYFLSFRNLEKFVEVSLPFFYFCFDYFSTGILSHHKTSNGVTFFFSVVAVVERLNWVFYYWKGWKRMLSCVLHQVFAKAFKPIDQEVVLKDAKSREGFWQGFVQTWCPLELFSNFFYKNFYFLLFWIYLKFTKPRFPTAVAFSFYLPFLFLP